MGEDRRKYQNDRTLIEASRILTPQFSGTTITIDGAQVELLRNIVSYLHQERTFVSEYHGTYYLTASDADFDDLSAIVADLEEKLMGNPNTVWGYEDRLVSQEDDTETVNATKVQSHTPPVAGCVHRIIGFSLWSDKNVSSAIVFANFSGTNYAISGPFALAAGVYKVVSPFDLVLTDDDYLVVSWAGLVVPQRVISNAWGYKMTVPA